MGNQEGEPQGDGLPPDNRHPDDIASARGTRVVGKTIYVAPASHPREWGKVVWICLISMAVVLITATVLELTLLSHAPQTRPSPSASP